MTITYREKVDDMKKQKSKLRVIENTKEKFSFFKKEEMQEHDEQQESK